VLQGGCLYVVIDQPSPQSLVYYCFWGNYAKHEHLWISEKITKYASSKVISTTRM